jgi:exopolyphosphatase / guanosine-5'-triphosphate,3'-diphosphate pyrophosphatase
MQQEVTVSASSRIRRAAVHPLRAAGIDVGSNAIRLLVAEFTSMSAWVILTEQRVPLRLGASVFATGGGVLDAQVLDAAVAALASFRHCLEELSVDVYRAAATSAAREARNGVDLVTRARTDARLDLELISGSEEARLVWLAVAARLPLQDRSWALVEVGGGSVEVALARGDSVEWAETHPLGTVRLLEALQQEHSRPADFRRAAGEHIDDLAAGIRLQADSSRGLVATGGNIEALARLCRVGTDAGGVSTLRLQDLSRAIDALARLSPEQRMERYGLRRDRADVILPAALVYERIAQKAGAATLLVPNVGLKEGLLLAAARNADGSAL